MKLEHFEITFFVDSVNRRIIIGRGSFEVYNLLTLEFRGSQTEITIHKNKAPVLLGKTVDIEKMYSKCESYEAAIALMTDLLTREAERIELKKDSLNNYYKNEGEAPWLNPVESFDKIEYMCTTDLLLKKDMTPGVVYLAPKDDPKWLGLFCPCGGCNPFRTITLNVSPGHPSTYTYEFNEAGEISVSPRNKRDKL